MAGSRFRACLRAARRRAQSRGVSRQYLSLKFLQSLFVRVALFGPQDFYGSADNVGGLFFVFRPGRHMLNCQWSACCNQMPSAKEPMPTPRQITGLFGEKKVVQDCICPRCKHSRTLKRLPPNFKCADVICDFCGYLAQVKTSRVQNIDSIPKTILGAAWRPQNERMKAGIYFPLFLVLVCDAQYSIFYLAADLQTESMFRRRAPLSDTAKRARWQGFVYNLEPVRNSFVRLP